MQKTLQLKTSTPEYFINKYGTNGKLNKIHDEDSPVHNWYRFVLSYPPHLVRDYLESFGAKSGDVILDPFCGTGTTLVEAKKNGFDSVGIEANPIAYLASTVKTDWNVNTDHLLTHAQTIAKEAAKKVKQPLRKLDEELEKLILKDSISPKPLHKTIILVETIEKHRDKIFTKYELLALAKTTVFENSNLHFGPEVGVKGFKEDTDVIGSWLKQIERMINELKEHKNKKNVETKVIYADSRNLINLIADKSINYVITSPPYPNEKDYTRTTRLESVLLGFIKNKQDLRNLKYSLVRSNTRSIYKADTDDRLISHIESIQKIANAIEKRRIELQKTSGFEKNYARVTKLYFGGMAKHLADLRPKLKKGAMLAYVVGDQASYLRVMIRTGQILAEIAEELGYDVVNIDLFRTRLSTATKDQLREEVLILKWPK
jgi:hypothetical protein